MIMKLPVMFWLLFSVLYGSAPFSLQETSDRALIDGAAVGRRRRRAPGYVTTTGSHPRRAPAVTGARFSGSPESLTEASAALPMI